MGKLSLSDFNTRKASAVPHRFEFIMPDGTGSGFFIDVIGDNAEAVVAERNRLINEDRQRAMNASAVAKPGIPGAAQPIERDIEFGEKLAAVRIVGWDGVDDPFTPEAALDLVKNSPEVREQVIAQSQLLGNFIQRSSKTS